MVRQEPTIPLVTVEGAVRINGRLRVPAISVAITASGGRRPETGNSPLPKWGRIKLASVVSPFSHSCSPLALPPAVVS
jgi:hypothetical protein